MSSLPESKVSPNVHRPSLAFLTNLVKPVFSTLALLDTLSKVDETLAKTIKPLISVLRNADSSLVSFSPCAVSIGYLLLVILIFFFHYLLVLFHQR